MERLNLFTGGHPFQVDDLGTMQAGIIDALKGVCNGIGNGQSSFIIQGVVQTGFIISPGYIYFQGEVFPVDSQGAPTIPGGGAAYWQIQEVTLAPSPVTYQNAVVQNVHVRRRMILVGALVPPLNSILASILPRLNQVLGLTPQNGIIMYSGLSTNFTSTGLGKPNTQVHGWALCNGVIQPVPTGGTLTTPNLRGKFIVGFDERTSGADTDYDAIGDTGGEKMHKLSKEELPPHKHGLAPKLQIIADQANGSPNLAAKVFHTDMSTGGLTPFAPSYTPSEDGTIDGIGFDGAEPTKGVPHENRPPYYTLAYIIKLL